MYLCLSKNSEYIEQDNIYISKSGVNHFSCNFAIIESTDSIIQQKIINENFNCSGLIFSTEDNKGSIDHWASDEGFQYIGKFPLLNQEQKDKNIYPNNVDGITIERVYNTKQFEDFFKVFTKIRNLSEEESVKMFSTKMFEDNYFLYVAYYKEVPAGIFFMINTDEGMMVVFLDVLKEFRDLDILTTFAPLALHDAINKNILNYYAIATSPFSYKVASSYGTQVEGYVHLWQKISTNKDNGGLK